MMFLGIIRSLQNSNSSESVSLQADLREIPQNRGRKDGGILDELVRKSRHCQVEY